ncbi:putative membrane protein [Synechococcus sp. SYN20]|nr:putative membrane protein [Synechococcus sp. SYN20]
MIGFGGFIVGAVEFALWVRILTELTRLPSFKEEGMTDQVRLCYVVLIGCVIGLIRLRFYP